MHNFLGSAFWGPVNKQEFIKGLQHAVNQLEPAGVYASDNLFTFGRQLSFLSDPAFMSSVDKNATAEEKTILWRTYIVCWAARHGLRRGGDFVECGCLKGTTARIVCDYLDFGRVDKCYFLYDLFDHTPDQQHPRLPGHGPELLPEVRQRFADLPNVNIVPGLLPDVLHQTSPEQIAFLHIDLNSAPAEVGCLELLFDRLSPGAILILDDYGWSWGIYKAQKFAEDPFFEARGYQVLELPTGQGVVIK